jgi:Na+/H+-dicarboxylate symporter
LDRVSLTTRVLIALIAGVGVGLALSTIDGPLGRGVIAVAEPVGALFINAIRMTVIPLVASTLIAGIASSRDRAAIARGGARGLIVFVSLLIASGVFAAIVAPPVLSRVELEPTAAATLRASGATAASDVAASSGAIQTPAQWLVALVPTNPIKAAADGAMLPLILFSLALGLALLAVGGDRRDRAVTFFRAIAEAMLVVVRWLLVLAPLGVFALTLPLVARLGLSAIGALATYVGLVSVLAIVFTIAVVYPAAVVGGRMSLREFARAAAPAQAVAISSRSSLAALPALIEAARGRLRLPTEITGFFLPLANAVFRVGAMIAFVTGALFIARLYAVPVSTAQLATLVVTALVTSFSIPGIPGGSIVAMVPVLSSVGLPVEGIGILLGVDTIPDIFRTASNVTGQLAAGVIVARGARAPASELASEASAGTAAALDAAVPATVLVDD